MFIKQTRKKLKGKTYSNYLLVESVATARGPRHRVVCSLGSLAPAPREHWLRLAHNLQDSLSGQESLLAKSAREQAIAAKLAAAPHGAKATLRALEFDTEALEVEQARQAGAVHVGHQIWERLGLEEMLAKAGLSHKTRLLTELMVLNRLIEPASELAMSEWVRRSALGDILKTDFSALNEERLYRNMDQLYPKGAQIEAALCRREKSLFSLKENILLYDLTSTYFEGLCLANPKAQRGYSRDSRPDCKQVLIGLVLDAEGFPKAHEVFAGNRPDTTTVDEMLGVIEQRMGNKAQATVVVDRGMASAENLAAIRARGHHWLVAGHHSERADYLEQFEEEEGWQEMVREASPRNPGQRKVRVLVKPAVGADGAQTLALCWSEGRTLKDRAIRESAQARFLADIENLQRRIASGRLRQEAKIHEAIGRLKERYSRVARYYQIHYERAVGLLSWREDQARKKKAQALDGSYLLKTSRSDLDAEEIWRTYILLTRPLGLSQAVSVRIGQARGAGEERRYLPITLGALGMAVLIMAIFAVTFIGAGATISAWFVVNVAVTALAAQLLLAAGVFQIFDGIQITSSGALRGFEDTRVPMFIGVLSYWLVALPISYLCAFKLGFGPQGIWFGFVTGLALAAVALVARLLLRLKHA